MYADVGSFSSAKGLISFLQDEAPVHGSFSIMQGDCTSLTVLLSHHKHLHPVLFPASTGLRAQMPLVTWA